MANAHRTVGQSVALLDTFRLYERSSQFIWNTVRHIDDRIISNSTRVINCEQLIRLKKDVLLFIRKYSINLIIIFDQKNFKSEDQIFFILRLYLNGNNLKLRISFYPINLYLKNNTFSFFFRMDIREVLHTWERIQLF